MDRATHPRTQTKQAGRKMIVPRLSQLCITSIQIRVQNPQVNSGSVQTNVVLCLIVKREGAIGGKARFISDCKVATNSDFDITNSTSRCSVRTEKEMLVRPDEPRGGEQICPNTGADGSLHAVVEQAGPRSDSVPDRKHADTELPENGYEQNEHDITGSKEKPDVMDSSSQSSPDTDGNNASGSESMGRDNADTDTSWQCLSRSVADTAMSGHGGVQVSSDDTVADTNNRVSDRNDGIVTESEVGVTSDSVLDDHLYFDKKRRKPILTPKESRNKVSKGPYKYIVVDMDVGVKRMVRDKPRAKAIVSAQQLSGIITALTDKVQDTTKVGREAKKHGKDDTDDMDVLDYLSSPPAAPHMQQWITNMLRSSNRSPNRTVQQQASHSAGLENEWNRVCTFSQYTVPEGIYVLPIAQNGFFLHDTASSNVDASQVRVKCAFCGALVPLMQFRGRDVAELHRQLSPTCRFLLGRDVGNVSIADFARTSGTQFFGSLQSQGTIPAPRLPAAYGPPVSSQQAAEPMDTDGAQIPDFAQLVPAQLPEIDQTPAGHPGNVLSTASYTATLSQPYTLPSPQPPGQTPQYGQTPQTGQTTPAGQTPQAGQTTPAGQTAQAGQTTQAGQTDTDSERGEGSSTQNEQPRQMVTYEDLGIFSQAPKRPDLAVTQVRINTFEGWPYDSSHPREKMAEAGFYYTGHVDLVRCFHCKGGLKTWERSDQPWVEHCRWFPRCHFIRLCKGQKFVDVVQELSNPETNPTISEEVVNRRVREMELEERRNLGLPTPAISTVPGSGSILQTYPRTTSVDAEEMERLEDENDEMRNTALCKVCQVKEVNILFLPCGHLVACAQCAPALRTCAICRQPVKGSVRVLLDEKTPDDNTDEEGEMENAAGNT